MNVGVFLLDRRVLLSNVERLAVSLGLDTRRRKGESVASYDQRLRLVVLHETNQLTMLDLRRQLDADAEKRRLRRAKGLLSWV